MQSPELASPRQAPCGIDWVVLNGQVKVEAEEVAVAACGQLIRRAPGVAS